VDLEGQTRPGPGWGPDLAEKSGRCHVVAENRAHRGERSPVNCIPSPSRRRNHHHLSISLSDGPRSSTRWFSSQPFCTARRWARPGRTAHQGLSSILAPHPDAADPQLGWSRPPISPPRRGLPSGGSKTSLALQAGRVPLGDGDSGFKNTSWMAWMRQRPRPSAAGRTCAPR